MRRIFAVAFLLTVFLFSNQDVIAQEKLLTLEDVGYMNPSIFPKSVRQLAWKGDSDYYTHVVSNKLVSVSAKTLKADTILTVDKLNQIVFPIIQDSLKRIPYINWISENEFLFQYKNRLLVVDMKSATAGIVNKFIEGIENQDTEYNGYKTAYTLENNLFVADNGRISQVTNDYDPAIINGQTVHRNEFGISKGTFWSPDGNLLAFYRKDERMVTDYPMVDVTSRIAQLDNIKYPMAGMNSHHVTVGVFNPASGKVVFLETGEPADQYLTNLSWSPDEKHIYIAVLNRDQNHMKLNQYDATNGMFVKTLFDEKSERYVEPEHGMYFLPSKPEQFVWLSERDGFEHLYLYNTEGELLKQITKGDWVVTDLLGTDPKGRMIYYVSTEVSPLDRNLYAVDLNSGKKSIITGKEGTHNIIMNSKATYFLDRFSSVETARAYYLYDRKGNLKQTISEDEDPLEEYNMGEMDIFTIKGENDLDLYCRLIKPSDFDPSKKYPAIVYVYGGPHAQLVTNSWLGGAGFFLNYLAQQGYVIFTLDNRGSANRGFEFESVIHRNLGTVEVADQMKGVEYLKSLNFIDTNRIGVDGWSYGGFMTISMLLKNPGVFKAGVAGGPVIDWKYYEIMYGERYMDSPESNPDGYAEANLNNHVENLDANLMVIHGTVDPVVVWQHSLSFIQHCIEKGIMVDYFVYPGHEHGVRGSDRMHLNKLISNYFIENL